MAVIGLMTSLVFLSDTTYATTTGPDLRATRNTAEPLSADQGRVLLEQFSAAFQGAVAKVNPSEQWVRQAIASE